jgi:hypothetical protein
VRQLEGRDDDAIAKFRESLALFAQTEYLPQKGVVHLEFAERLLRLGRAEDAAEQLTIAESLIGPQSAGRAARIESLRDVLGARKR